jgi:secreted trypsin-like serine protease
MCSPKALLGSILFTILLSACEKSHLESDTLFDVKPQSQGIIHGDLLAADSGFGRFTVGVTFLPVENGKFLAGKGRDCTGVIVGLHSILTAAHCFLVDEKIWTGSYVIRVIYTNTMLEPSSTLPQLGYTSNLVIHHSYTGLHLFDGNDLAMAKLKQPIPSVKQVAPILQDSSALDTAKTLITTGFGYTEKGEAYSDHLLRQVQLTPKNINYSPHLMEFDESSFGTSHGDSGGPSFVQDNSVWKLAGIDSFGNDWDPKGPAKQDNRLGYKVNVASWYAWITETRDRFEGVTSNP